VRGVVGAVVLFVVVLGVFVVISIVLQREAPRGRHRSDGGGDVSMDGPGAGDPGHHHDAGGHHGGFDGGGHGGHGGGFDGGGHH
jgi:hypothetical protein